VTGSDDRKVKVVVAETGHVIYNPAFHDDWVRTVIYTTHFFISGSDDGQVIFAHAFLYANKRNRTVRIYKASTGTVSGEAWSIGKMGYIMIIAVSPGGKVLAAGNSDYSITLYDMDTRKMIRNQIRGHNRVRTSDILHTPHTYSGDPKAIRCLVFSRDSQQLVSCGDDQTVRLWNVSTGKKSCEPLYGNTSSVSSVEFSPDMKQLVTGESNPSQNGPTCCNHDVGQVVKMARYDSSIWIHSRSRTTQGIQVYSVQQPSSTTAIPF